MKPLLSVIDLTKTFGGLKAFQDISLDAFGGKILTIIGPNGAGKTTLFNTLTGIYTPDSGVIYFEGERVDGLSPAAICDKGMARTFQNIRLFGEMTALENIQVAEFSHDRTAWHDLLLRTPSFIRSERESVERAFHLLERVGLVDSANLLARNLPYGLQRKLEIARALATNPRMLLLDEPGAGMNPTELNDLIQIILKLREEGMGILLIEHHMKVVMQISDQVVVLDHGEELAKGIPSEISVNPQVISAYLGEALASH